jgi:NAD(P)-dependent dehydrogenase (short-subunit alcohol dehydrogenase family)
MTPDQRVAIVTGGSSGIGRATAVALGREERAKVVVAARREKEGEETVQQVKDTGSDSIFVKTDVANEDDVKALVEKTIKAYGRLDYAVNNAGFDEAETTLVEETSSD